MLASRPLREAFRQRFGAHPQQRLVLISSTWAHTSLYGRDPSLVSRIARQLPLDEYRIVVALHPNIWYGHTPWQVRSWIDEWVRAGVIVLPPEEGWRAALVAADVTIGDHGSVTFYSAALGNPVLLASWPLGAVDGRSPIAELLRTAPRLDADVDLRSQVDAVVDEHDPEWYEPITACTTSFPGESASMLRSAVYERLDLDEPMAAAETKVVPLPTAEDSPLHSQVVHVQLDDADQHASVTRFSAGSLQDATKLPPHAVLVTSTAESTRRWLEWADILVHHDTSPHPEQWIHATLARLPSAQLAAIRDEDGRWVVAGAVSPPVRFTASLDLGSVCATFLHSWIAADNSVADLPTDVHLRLGKREVTVTVEIH